jgi:hypothetical protein
MLKRKPTDTNSTMVQMLEKAGKNYKVAITVCSRENKKKYIHTK